MTERALAPDLPDLILFDGACGLCSGWVRFVLARDTRARWLFVPIQSPLGRALAARFGIDADDPETNAVVRQGRIHTRLASVEAVLRDWPAWRWVLLGRAMPRPLRDALYGAIARNRYRLFGRACLVPDRRWAHRIIEQADALPTARPLWPDDATLPAPVRDLHAAGSIVLVGRADVADGRSRAGRILAWLAGFPAPGPDQPVRVEIQRMADGEIWTRHFAGRRMVSRLTRSPRPGAHLRESLHGLACDIALTTEPLGQVWRAQGWRWYGIPIPTSLAPRISAIESADGSGRYRFAVQVRWGALGRLAAYSGWLEPAEPI